jgi:hypothetical protein
MDPIDHAGGGQPAGTAQVALSHRFIEVLAPTRDHLYRLALAHAASPAAAESAMQKAARELFHRFTTDPHFDLASALAAALAPADTPAPPAGENDTAMPADAWARLAAAVQFEAAHSAHSGALNPESVLLQPDPLLAPKKTKPRADDTAFDVASPSRLLTMLGAVLLAGLLITLYILTRPAPPSPPPAVPVPHAPATNPGAS